MFHYRKTPQGNLEISVSGVDIRMFYRAMIGTGLLERRDMYGMKTYIEKNFRQELCTGSPVSVKPYSGKEAGNGNS